MKTNRAPWDYERMVAILEESVDICLDCGGYVYYGLRRKPNAFSCIRCGSERFISCLETQAAEWRAEIAKAWQIVGEIRLRNAFGGALLIAEWTTEAERGKQS